MTAKSDIDAVLRLAEKYRHQRGLRLSTVSLYATGRGGYLQDLVDGSVGMTLVRRDRIIEWFSDNWPDPDMAWPADIPRPPKTKQEVKR